MPWCCCHQEADETQSNPCLRTFRIPTTRIPHAALLFAKALHNRDLRMLGSPTKQGLQVDFGRQFWRELEDAGPDSGHSHRLNACFLRNPKRLTDSEVKVTFRVVVIDVAGCPCMDDVRIWKFEPWGHNGRSKSDWRVSAAVLFHFRSGGGGDVTELLTSL